MNYTCRTVNPTSQTSAENGHNNETIVLRILESSVLADHGLPASLMPLFETFSRGYAVGGSRGFIGCTVRHGPHVDARGGVWFLRGLLPKVVAGLERLGRTFEIIDESTPRPRVEVDGEVVAALNQTGQSFAIWLAANWRGVIHNAGDNRRAALVAAASVAFPAARIAVATTSRSLARSFRDRLRARVDEPVLLLHRHGHVVSPARIQVATCASLDFSADVLFFPEMTDLLTRTYITACTEVRNQHIYAFADPYVRLSAQERHHLEGLLGPATFWADRPDERRAGTRVLLADAPDVSVQADARGLDRKRQAIWHADRRNAAVAGVAIAFATGRLDDLYRFGLSPDHATIGPLNGRATRVAVLVESVEHARALAQVLPGWSVLDGSFSDEAPVDAVNRMGTGGAVEPAMPVRSIVTAVRAQKTGSLDVDVLIRADGGDSPLGLPGFPPRDRRGTQRDVLLVDFGDEGDETAIDTTRCRLDDYETRGWVVEAPARWHRRHDFDEAATTVGR